MKRNLLFWTLVIIVLAATGILVYNHRQEQVTTGQSSAEVQTAPNFTLPDLTGEKISLQDYRGKVVLLNFWTTWCPYCKVEMPELAAAYQKYRDKGFVVLSVDMTAQEKTPGAVKDFIAQKGYNFPVLLDEKGNVSSQYSISSIPTSFLIDTQGRIVSVKIGPFAPSELDTKLKQMLK